MPRSLAGQSGPRALPEQRPDAVPVSPTKLPRFSRQDCVGALLSSLDLGRPSVLIRQKLKKTEL